MTDEQKAAYIFSLSVAMLAEIEAMKAANIERDRSGQSIAYKAERFFALVDEYNLSPQAVLRFFEGPRELTARKGDKGVRR